VEKEAEEGEEDKKKEKHQATKATRDAHGPWIVPVGIDIP